MRTRVDRRMPPGAAATLVDDTEIEALPALPQAGGIFGVGDVVDGRYRVVRLVRESGSARIFCGENLVTGARVWIEQWLRHPERFRARARILAPVRHRNVMRLLDALADPMLLVFELPQAVPLHHLIRAEGRFEPSRALRIAERVCWGADALHAAGIARVDVSAAVVMLTRDSEMSEEPIVMDVGDAASEGQLGRLLLHMLTGHEPAPLVVPATAESELRACGVPRGVARFVGDLLAHRQTGSARELAAALHQLRRRHACVSPRTWRGATWIAAAIAAAALSLLVGRAVARAIDRHEHDGISFTSSRDASLPSRNEQNIVRAGGERDGSR